MNTKFIEELSQRIGIKAEELAKGLESEDSNIELPKGKFWTDEDIDSLKDNVGKAKYDEAKIASSEMLLKELSRDAGLETIKDKNKFVEAFKSKILEEAKVEPQQKQKELEEVIENLRLSLKTKDDEINSIKKQFEETSLKSKVISYLPDLPEHVGLTKDEAMSLFFIKHKIEGDAVIKDGKPLKDNLERNLQLKDAVDLFVQERKWNDNFKGREQKPNYSQVKSIGDFEGLLKEKGIREGSAEANALLATLAKENPDILN